MARKIAEKCSEQELLFVEAYCGEARFNQTEAARLANYKDGTHTRKGYELMQRTRVIKAIKARMDKRKAVFWLREDDILNGLHTEALDHGMGSSHSARVSAWVQLGKHIGMFKDKEVEVDKQITYQVINYNTGNDKLEVLKKDTEKALENLSEKDLKEAEHVIIDGVSITDYSDTER